MWKLTKKGKICFFLGSEEGSICTLFWCIMNFQNIFLYSVYRFYLYLWFFIRMCYLPWHRPWCISFLRYFVCKQSRFCSTFLFAEYVFKNYWSHYILLFVFFQVDLYQLQKPWLSSFFKLKGFRGEKAVAPNWFSMKWLFGCCVNNIDIPSYSAKKYRPPHFIYFIWESSVKNNLLGTYFSVMQVFYIFVLELLVVFD